MKFLIIFTINILLTLLLFYNSSFLNDLNDDLEIIIVVAIINMIFILPLSKILGFCLHYKLFKTSNNLLKELKENYEVSFAYTIGIAILIIANLFFNFLPTDPIEFLIISSIPALFIGMIFI
ncbi:hypothetical protein FE773_00895 [Caminibacter mediatlanticus TB-2]|uniref:Uncharacterized protein n=1 Tax=Caminibacter mediatlanticus TB-2 TaxID=391592 RepID=A0ABX5V725_9BACT|nr:hypothetical protein [Caminibacter mediatlanticus]QCT93784.1 hypothetical protein FE773_00895 [Caminibacter mediatlanticus TB-2]